METATLTDMDIRKLTVGQMYLLLGLALPEFPGTSASSPSLWVVVYPKTKIEYLRDEDRYHFPFKVTWTVWRDVVVPLIADASMQKILSQRGSLKTTSGYLRWFDRVKQAVLEKLQSGRYVPLTSHDWPEEVSAEEAPTEDPTYTQHDQGIVGMLTYKQYD